ncbi:MAG: tol-pal system protein YbgF [Cytophagales bacterium CG12_big_fil_rev_8_21_14_0_65_40_12]|nr:MAG: tol-pal system protein YbgF [Cytophagales bacterium CG12_big_fil_rev_8_21_14_0_65_40_12]PIW04788.1 MAG: tol-pal system protein YbgF [Cytophagales bacterium CG17_big_fil_post_rev_8_21_14_2_50_40_13]
MRFKNIVLGVVAALLFNSAAVQAQSKKERVESDTSRYLLLNLALQHEITTAVDNMYNFDFHKAEVEFNWLKYNYPEHPLGYFLFGISTWWQMMPNLDKESPLGEEFLAYMDTAIYKSEAILEQDEDNMEANFFLAGAYGFQGRYHSEKRNWGKATNTGRLALKYLEKSQGNESFSPEILFGDALFNYYSIWIREEYPMLRPILLFFPRGDKALGLKQLETVATNAFYTRVEAIFFLMRIKAFETNETFEALRLSEYIFGQYPNNPYFHRFYARMLYSAGQMDATEKESLEILKRFDAGMEGYEEMSARYACFYLGAIHRGRRNWEVAEPYYKRAISYSADLDLEDSGYHIYSLLHLAEYYVEQKRYDEAAPMLSKVRNETKRKESTNQKARELEKEIKRNKK